MLQVPRHFNDVLGIVDEVFRQVTMAKVDSALVVNLVARDVVAADQIENRFSWPSDRARDVIARNDFLDLCPHFNNLAKALMPDDQMVATGRGVPVEGLVDLSIGRVDADLQHLHQHAAPLGYLAHVRMRLVRELGDRNLTQMHAVRLAGQNGYGFHQRLARSGKVFLVFGQRGNVGSAIADRLLWCFMASPRRSTISARAHAELINRRLGIGRSRTEDCRRKLRLVDRVRIMLGFEAKRLLFLVDDSAFAFERPVQEIGRVKLHGRLGREHLENSPA